MKSPKKNGIGEVVTEYGARVMKVIKKGLLGRSLFDFYGDIKAQAFKTKEMASVPSTPADGKGGVIYTKSADGKLYYKSNEVAEVELSASDTVLTSEQVQDIVGGMLVGTETRIGVTYDDTNGRIDFVVDDMTADTNTQNTTTLSFVDSSDDVLLRNTTGGAGSGTDDIKFVAGSNVTLTHTDADNITIAATDTNTTYSEATGSAEGLMSIAHHDKLDGIESSADVTDATNVTAAGALMDSELTDLSGVKSLDTSTLVTLAGTQSITGDKTFNKKLTLDADKSVTAGTDGVTLHVDSQDITDGSTSGSGTATVFNHVLIQNPRLLATNSSVTTTTASTVRIKGAPVAHTNQTITNAYALYVSAGNSYFGSPITANEGVVGDVTGNVSGTAATVTGAAQTNITSLGTLTNLQVDDINLNAKIIKIDGSTDDYFQITATTDGATNIKTHDQVGTDAHLEIEPDGDLILIPATGDTKLSSSVAYKPNLQLINSDTGNKPSYLTFEKTDTGTDGDYIGTIEFKGKDGSDNSQIYGQILCSMEETTHTDEAGLLDITVAASDGTTPLSKTGLKLTGSSSGDRHVDVSIANGTTSSTTVSGSLTVTSDLTVNGDTVTFESANADDPHVVIKNTNDGTNEGARLDFNKLRADDGVEQGQNLGEIWFTGQDSAQNSQDYAYIVGEIDVGTDGQESGQIAMGVATHDGELQAGFTMTGGAAEDRIDVTIGNMSSSTTTIAGKLDVTGDITLIGRDIVSAENSDIRITSDTDIIFKIDADNDGTNQYQFNNGSAEIATLSNHGDLQIDGDLTVSGNDIKDDDGTTCITFDSSGNTTIAGTTSGTFSGNLTGNASGTAATVTAAAQPNITSLHSSILLTKQVKVTLSTADCNALNSTPIELVAAQGADTVIVPTGGMIRVDRAATQTNSSANINFHYADKEPGTAGQSSVAHYRRFMYNEIGDRVFHISPAFFYSEVSQNLTDDVNKALEVSVDSAFTNNCFTSIDIYLTYNVFDIS